jgi:hypothetical protein
MQQETEFIEKQNQGFNQRLPEFLVLTLNLIQLTMDFLFHHKYRLSLRRDEFHFRAGNSFLNFPQPHETAL